MSTSRKFEAKNEVKNKPKPIKKKEKEEKKLK